MSWTLNASGHCDADAEAALIADLKEVLANEAYAASTGMLYTSHHGAVNLFAVEQAAEAAEEAQAE